MGKEKENKSNKLLFLFLVLLILTVTGFAGYKIYSYFYTSSRLNTGEDSIYLSSFKPVLYGGNGGVFVGGDHYNVASTRCDFVDYNSDSQIANYNCYSEISVKNDGSKPVTISIEYLEFMADYSNVNNLVFSEPTYQIVTGNNQVQPGDFVTFSFSADIEVHEMNVDPRTFSTDYQFVSEGVTGGVDLDAYFRYNIIAEEVHD